MEIYRVAANPSILGIAHRMREDYSARPYLVPRKQVEYRRILHLVGLLEYLLNNRMSLLSLPQYNDTVTTTAHTKVITTPRMESHFALF